MVAAMSARWPCLLAVLVAAACTHSAATPADLSADVADPVDATDLADADDVAADANAEEDAVEVDLGPPIRTLLQRPWLATPTNNLLLDTLEDNGNSWGKLAGIELPTALSQSFSVRPAYLYSDSPLGSAVPIGIAFPPQSNVDKVKSRKIVAAFSGTGKQVNAGIWLAGRDAADKLVTTPGKVGISVAILPTDASEATAYPLQSDGTPPLKTASGYWNHFVLPAPVAVPHGGWLIITLAQPNARLWLMAPEVVPTTTTAGKSHAHGVHVTQEDRDAITAYAQRLHDLTPPRTERKADLSGAHRER